MARRRPTAISVPRSRRSARTSSGLPTVFSYYPAFYQAPDTTILGPEFGIFDQTTALKRANFVNTMVFSRISATGPTGNAPNGTSLDLALP